MAATEYKGLDPQEVIASRERYGGNIITPVSKTPVWKLFFEKFNDPIIKILLIAAALTLVIAFIEKEFAETIGIICAVLLATGVSFWFEYKAKKRFEILNVVNDDTPVKAIRAGEVVEIPKKEVVVGDILVLGSGDEIAADGTLIESVSMRVNESSLTGEQSVSKTTVEKDFKTEATYPSNMLLRGTTVLEGSGIMTVDAVGDMTEYGKVSEQSTIESKEDTPLNKQLHRLSGIIGKAGAVLAVSVFLIMLVKGLFIDKSLLDGGWLQTFGTLLQYFMVSVAIMVMAVPEGLPMSITVSLAMSMQRMLKTNNLVRKMHACETMGAVTVICTDKTGTFTQNIMQVGEMVLKDDMDTERISEMIALNSTAFVDHDGKVIGNPTEGALLNWTVSAGEDYRQFRRDIDVVDQLSFTTENKFMATIVESRAYGRRMVYVKGAPEIVKKMCSVDAGTETIFGKLAGFQSSAMRTLAFAFSPTTAEDCETAVGQGGLTFAGIAAISDPVREDVPQAVKECTHAGIAIKIVTGDTPATAREIARRIGLWIEGEDGPENEITGIEFAAMSDEELLERISALKIMARARPLDKQRLVKLLQQKGEVVAVTGDGTNDAPALNFAQVGLSMGSGTSVAKEASDITLLDDSFASIVTAVMWGRSLYKNIQRFILFQLTVNLVALAVVFFGSIFGSELPLTVTQILWVNIIMDTFAAMALASLPPEPGVMDDKPRKESDFIITRPMIKRIAGMGAVFIVILLGLLIWWGRDADIYRLTIFFTLFVLLQFWNLFNAKAYDAKAYASHNLRQSLGFLGILAAILFGQVIIVTFGGDVFRTVPLSLSDWITLIAGSSLVMVLGECYRAFRKRNNDRAPAAGRSLRL